MNVIEFVGELTTKFKNVDVTTEIISYDPNVKVEFNNMNCNIHSLYFVSTVNSINFTFSTLYNGTMYTYSYIILSEIFYSSDDIEGLIDMISTKISIEFSRAIFLKA